MFYISINESKPLEKTAKRIKIDNIIWQVGCFYWFINKAFEQQQQW